MGIAAGTVVAAPFLIAGGVAVTGLAGGALLACRNEAKE
jgi:hypothetical protein